MKFSKLKCGDTFIYNNDTWVKTELGTTQIDSVGWIFNARHKTKDTHPISIPEDALVRKKYWTHLLPTWAVILTAPIWILIAATFYLWGKLNDDKDGTPGTA